MKEYRLLKKITAIICLLLLTTSCTSTLPSAAQPMQPEQSEKTLQIPYCESDSLNPFFCEGEENSRLWPLAFLPLYELDNQFSPQAVMADTAVQTGTQLQITLQPNMMTAQGTLLSVADVLYSFRLAKESPAFKTQLSVFESVSIGATSDVIIFTLKRPNINACSLLTFPIVQYGTADNASSLPMGAGPYSYVKTAEGFAMQYNPNYYDGNARCAQITLVDTAADASKAFSLKSERIHCSFSNLADGEVLRIAATATTVPMTNLVFIGVNADRKNLNSAAFRQALSFALDRQAIVDHAFCGYAEATAIPVHPQWSNLQTEEYLNNTSADIVSAKAKLTEYETGESEIVEQEEFNVSDILEDNYTLELICCQSNAFKTGTAAQIAEQLKAINIAVTVRSLPEEDYYDAVENGDYDLYLGEVRLTADMNMAVFLLQGNPLGWGIDNDAITSTAVWDSYCAGAVSLSEFLSVFSKELPFIPLCYRQGIFYTSRSLINEIFCTPDNLYDNITVWEPRDAA